ncbi:MAG: NTP transferase domain-containing protein [Hyphomicrobiales bacterium]
MGGQWCGSWPTRFLAPPASRRARRHGTQAPAVEHALQGANVRFAFNTHWRDGMGGSIALGVSKLAATLDGAAIVPGDMPFLTSSVVDMLGAKFQELNERSRSSSQRRLPESNATP